MFQKFRNKASKPAGTARCRVRLRPIGHFRRSLLLAWVSPTPPPRGGPPGLLGYEDSAEPCEGPKGTKTTHELTVAAGGNPTTMGTRTPQIRGARSGGRTGGRIGCDGSCRTGFEITGRRRAAVRGRSSSRLFPVALKGGLSTPQTLSILQDPQRGDSFGNKRWPAVTPPGPSSGRCRTSCWPATSGAGLAEAAIRLRTNGRDSRFIDQVFLTADTSDFVGSRRCLTPEPGLFSAVAFELDGVHRIFTTLPVVPVVEVP